MNDIVVLAEHPCLPVGTLIELVGAKMVGCLCEQRCSAHRGTSAYQVRVCSLAGVEWVLVWDWEEVDCRGDQLRVTRQL